MTFSEHKKYLVTLTTEHGNLAYAMISKLVADGWAQAGTIMMVLNLSLV
jgi:hypothetical protein